MSLSAAIVFLAAWASLIALGLLARSGPRDDLMTSLAWRLCRLYCRVMHRVEVRGVEHIPSSIHPGPLIIVANHTAGIDPIVIQAAVPFFVRWLMARKMMLPRYQFIWDWAEIIPVSGNGRELASARSAMRALEAGDVIGIFPEGGIERPHQTIMPFVAGVGLIIAKTGAPVLPVVIEGAPQTLTAWGSLLKTSRTRVTFMPRICYAKSSLKADEIAKDLERRYAQWTRWPVASNAE